MEGESTKIQFKLYFPSKGAVGTVKIRQPFYFAINRLTECGRGYFLKKQS